MKTFFTTLLAVLSAFVVLFLGLLGIVMGAALLSDDDAPKVAENTLLRIDLNVPVQERTSDDPFSSFDFMTLEETDALGMNDFMTGLEAAAKDPKVEGILLNMGGFSIGYGMLEELGDYLREFQESGKKIYTYGEFYTQKGAYLGALADSSILNPGGLIDFRGLGISLTYYKDFFDKVGIEPLVVRGTGNNFKSAVEPYIASEMSEENRLQLTHMLEEFWSFLSEPFLERGLNMEDLNRMAADWTGMDATAAQQAGLVDALGYREDVWDHFEDRFELMDWADYLQTVERSKATDRVAVIYANGTIGNGSGDENSIGTQNIIKALRKAEENDKVKAIVLRVNSPGGSALTSDMIHHTIEGLTKPVVVSQGNYAASGGYYISCNADAIFTNNTTVTGSIGIFMNLFTAEELMSETLGLRIEEVKLHPLATFPNLYDHPDEGTYAILQRMIDQGYDDFTGKVAAGRDTTMEYIKSIGGGRVWTGRDALGNGLADREGNLKAAIAYAAELAEIEEYKLYELPHIETGLEKFTKAFGKATTPGVLRTIENHPALEEVKYLLENPGLQAKADPAFTQF